ncbi:GntR family transcriptional regulator [Actinoplanes sp. NPDC023801]|uniref:GntR family transcriptional regulator n=1 Tax=Actinoplanes sp. NPDC023801 TaxID=3154595 RepID=UPI0033F79A6D
MHVAPLLRARIRTGRLCPGQRLPSEVILQQEYGIGHDRPTSHRTPLKRRTRRR